jgi:hypothetical protein
MLNGEEKRELILAHAAAREQEPREWGLGYAVGLFATLLIVVTGWAYTFRQNIRARATPGPDPLIQGTRERVEDALPPVRQVKDSVEQVRRAYEEAVKAERARIATSTTKP